MHVEQGSAHVALTPTRAASANPSTSVRTMITWWMPGSSEARKPIASAACHAPFALELDICKGQSRLEPVKSRVGQVKSRVTSTRVVSL